MMHKSFMKTLQKRYNDNNNVPTCHLIIYNNDVDGLRGIVPHNIIYTWGGGGSESLMEIEPCMALHILVGQYYRKLSYSELIARTGLS